MAHYKPKKSKLQNRNQPQKGTKTQMQKKISFCVFCAFLWLLMNQQSVVGRFHAFGTEIEILAIQENFNNRRAFELALNQRL